MAQTAVEWIAEKMKKLTPPGYQIEFSYILQKAKQMEKEQIIEAHYVGFKNFVDTKEISEQYYNQTYGNESI